MLASGTKLGPYEIIGPLGAGGMGEVYRARDSRLDREVAIKVLSQDLAQDEAALKRFEREAKAVAALSHPNILSLHDIGDINGTVYAVMELLEGTNLRARIAEGRFPWQKALDIAIDMANGLAAAHTKGITHRDLKPENIFLTHDSRVKILDFGLAHIQAPIKQQEATELPTYSVNTQPGMVVGTVPYMSPEQVRGLAVDHRSDIFSFGCVLYELLSGKRPFHGATVADTVSAILNERPKPITDVPRPLANIVHRCLEKDADDRFSSSAELLIALQSLKEETSRPEIHLGREVSRTLLKPAVAVPIVFLILIAGFFFFRLIENRQKQKWARQTLPEISRLIVQEKFSDAFQLANDAQKYLPSDPLLKEFWPQLSRVVKVQTEPEGATVHIREYTEPDGTWQNLGVSPIDDVRIPLGSFVWKFEKAGYETVQITERFPYIPPTEIVTVRVTLDKQGSIPEGMVRARGGNVGLQMPGLDHLPEIPFGDYLIDRLEVTNAQFYEFVRSGGYQKEEYWKFPFVKDGRELSREEAMKAFRDSTGRPGPATWEGGMFLKGQENLPVTGVSWYEAAAYAQFAGKSLPTAYHWNYAAGTWDSSYVIPFSNFGTPGLWATGTKPAIHRFGSYDMAGNAKEWCFNETRGNRMILGGAWNEPTYLFNDPDAQPPFSRLPTYGFRCAKYLSAVPKEALNTIPWVTRDYRNEKPVSDDVFQIYKSLYSYDRTDLRPVVESTVESEHWRKEKITYDAGYGDERMLAFLFLPKNSRPPYQTAIYFPGSGVLHVRSPEQLEQDLNMRRIDFVIQSGRAVLFPIYDGTFGRGSAVGSDYPKETIAYRDAVIHWYKELARSIDYLETRKEIDSKRLAFYGVSWGGAMGLMLPAMEPRLKVNVLVVGGFYLQKTLPEVDQINFTSRVTIPTLMLNGRHDFFLPIETSQLPAFNLLGTPAKHKRQVVYETGHNIPRSELIRETLNWLDRYLGSVS